MSSNSISSDALQTSQLTKLYNIPRSKKKRIAVNNLDLSVAAGEIFGFLGPNGAGKTTTIKMLLSFIRPTEGRAWIFGESVALESARRQVGYVPEQPYFPKFLTSLELVRAHGAMSGLSGRDSARRAAECLELVGMQDVSHSPLSQLSKGMTQRIGLACAIVGDPKLLILDEPSSGLNPVGRRELRELLERFKKEGKTIFLSSHLLSEMEAVCDRVGILSSGQMVACGSPADIVQVRDQVAVEFDGILEDEAIRDQVGLWGGTVVAEEDQRREAGRDRGAQKALVPERSVYSFINLLQERKATLRGVKAQRESLEDAFLRLVKGAAQ